MKLIALVFLALLTGCATTKEPPRVVVQRVEVPIPVRCKVEVPARPDTTITESARDETTPRKAQIVLRDLEATRHYADILEAALRACAN